MTVEVADELLILTWRRVELVGRGIVLHNVRTMIEAVYLLMLSLCLLWWLPRPIRIIHSEERIIVSITFKFATCGTNHTGFWGFGVLGFWV